MAEHTTPYDCWCNPTVIPVQRNDGSIGYIRAHNEPDLTPEQNADRAATIYEAMEIIRLQTSDDY